MYEQRLELLRIYVIGVATFLTGLLGVDAIYLKLLLILMIVDTVLGWLKAIKLKMWKSSKAKWGFSGKLVQLIIISLTYSMDYVFGLDFLMRFTIFYYLIIELVSIIENIHEANLAPIPESLLEISHKFKSGVDKKIMRKLKGIIDKFFED